MDIAKYTGLFLVKNEYCFLPGIGSLQVVKKSARQEQDSENLLSPEYTVIYEQGHGSIDDSFANFIATNERISIVHASNYLKDYCKKIKQQLQEGEEVSIPAIGTFRMDAQQNIRFETDPHLDVKGRKIPFFKNSPTVTQRKEGSITKIIENTEIKEPKSDEEVIIKPPTVNWPKIIVLILVILAVIAVVVYFVANLVQNKAEQNVDARVEAQQPAVDSPQMQPVAAADSAPAITQTATPQDSFLVAINRYSDEAHAIKRSSQLKSYGNQTAVWTKDSVTFFVVIKVSNGVDKQSAVDSLKRLFNPAGNVEIVRQ